METFKDTLLMHDILAKYLFSFKLLCKLIILVTSLVLSLVLSLLLWYYYQCRKTCNKFVLYGYINEGFCYNNLYRSVVKYEE